MKNLLAIFGNNDTETSIAKKDGILTEPGDRLEARITKSGRKVVKIQKNAGKNKYSATQYPTGTVVETKVTKE